jgi:hypothetical protein
MSEGSSSQKRARSWASVECSECGAVGGFKELDNVPCLPRCACFLRTHRGKIPPAISGLLTYAPTLPDAYMRVHRTGAVVEDAFARSPPAVRQSDSANPVSGLERRTVWSVDKLPPSTEVMVYHTECCEEALLGCVVVTNEHKLSDVMQMVREELDVSGEVTLYRSSATDALKVPLNKLQERKLALPLFPAESYHLIVMEVGGDGTSDNEDGT